MRTCACLFCAAAVGMAMAAIGGGSYDYTQSLLPTDNRPLQLEGMRGGGGTAPTSEQMEMFRGLLEEALAKEIPLEDIDIVYMPDEDTLRLIVFVTDEGSGEEGTVKTESVTRSGADAPRTAAAGEAGSTAAGSVAPTPATAPAAGFVVIPHDAPRVLTEDNVIKPDIITQRIHNLASISAYKKSAIPTTLNAARRQATIQVGDSVFCEKTDRNTIFTVTNIKIDPSKGALLDLKHPNNNPTLDKSGVPIAKCRKVEQPSTILMSGGTRRRTRRTRHRTDRKNRPLRKSNHD